AATCSFQANQYGQCRDASRRVGIPGRAGGAGHAPVRGSVRNRVAVAGRGASGDLGESGAGNSRSFRFALIDRLWVADAVASARAGGIRLGEGGPILGASGLGAVPKAVDRCKAMSHRTTGDYPYQ